MFDFDNILFIQNQLNVNESITLYFNKHNNDIAYDTHSTRNPQLHRNESSEELISINANNERYYMTIPLVQNKLTNFPNDNSHWLIYKSTHFNNTNDYETSPKKSKRFHKVIEGDIIKLGRMYMKIWKICSDNNRDSLSNEYKTYNMKRSFSYVGLNSNSRNNSMRSVQNNNTFRNHNRNSIITYNRNYYLQPLNNNNKDERDKMIVLPRLISIEASRKYRKLKLKPFQRNTKDSEIDYTKSKQTGVTCNENENTINNNNNVMNILSRNNHNNISINNNNSNSINNNNNSINNNNDSINEQQHTSNELVCRICYGNDNELTNPLINPCECSGSMKYIHYLCLTTWINSQIEQNNPSIREHLHSTHSHTVMSFSYKHKALCCELCKSKYPDHFKYNDVIMNLTYYHPDPDRYKSYIIGETYKGETKTTRLIHIISFDSKTRITVGRSTDCDLHLPDLAISRLHCTFFMKNGRVYVEDSGSKFGTLVLIQAPKLHIVQGLPLHVQKGNHYMKVTARRKKCLFCCNVDEINNYGLTYQKQNEKYIHPYKYEQLITLNDISNVNSNSNNNSNNKTMTRSSIINGFVFNKNGLVLSKRYSIKTIKKPLLESS